MNYWKNSFLLCFISFLFVACNTSEKSQKIFFKKSSKQWKNYLKEIGVEQFDMSNHVFLITYSTACAPCINEIKWWNQAGPKINNLKITLIILEPYQSSFNSFLRVNDFTLPAFRDSAGIIFEHKLIPYPPVKVYFNKKGKITAIERIGTNGHLTAFVKLIKADR